MQSFPNAASISHSSAFARAEGDDKSIPAIDSNGSIFGGFAFKLYDTYGFPLDLTELMARERGLTVDVAGFNKLMEEQRQRSQAAIKRTVIKVADFRTEAATAFVGGTHVKRMRRYLR